MSADTLVDVARVAWLTLAFMMLLSRIVFQIAGPVWMRSFLNGWQSGRVKRVWGAAALVFGVYLLLQCVRNVDALSAFEGVLVVGLLVVLLADGLVNVLPSGFETFKTKMQDAWVARRRGTGREGDTYLFGTVNALLALGAVLVAVTVIAYRSIAIESVVLALVLAIVLTALLIGASLRESSNSTRRTTMLA